MEVAWPAVPQSTHSLRQTWLNTHHGTTGLGDLRSDEEEPWKVAAGGWEDDRANTIVATAAFVSEIDDIQYGIGQGPCITAAREGQTVMSGSLGSDPRWRSRGPCTRGPAGERDA